MLIRWTFRRGLLFTFLIGISILVDLFVRYNLKIELAPSSLLFFVGLMVDEPSNPPNSRVGRNQHFRLASIWWLLASIVLTNVYISFLVTNLNAPFPPKIFDTVESLYCAAKNENLTTNKLGSWRKRFEKRGEGDHAFHPNATLEIWIMQLFNFNNATFFRNLHESSTCFSILSNKTHKTLAFHPWNYELHKFLGLIKMSGTEFQLAHQFYTQPMRWYPKHKVPFASKLLLDAMSYMEYHNTPTCNPCRHL
ncbi:hypothetical protein Fcan01_22869 [Folsomia candida]|uniref:Uncharacterized protein n=1 Tax=Folsomia candida TaxID=158441 RepID=A0A226DBP6_FOLCA|nr:hypothetical protein Fcan01_22869 [Folsomia candida]